MPTTSSEWERRKRERPKMSSQEEGNEEDRFSAAQLPSCSSSPAKCQQQQSSCAGKSSTITVKDIRKIMESARLLLSSGLVCYTGAKFGRFEGGGDSPIVELRPWRSDGDVTAEKLAQLLFYLHYANYKTLERRRLTMMSDDGAGDNNGALTVLIDCRPNSAVGDSTGQKVGFVNLDLLNLCYRALCLLWRWLPTSLKRVYFVGLLATAAEQTTSTSRREFDLFDASAAGSFEVEYIGMDALKAEIDASELSVEFDGGERSRLGIEWLEFRKELDCFVAHCRRLAELYIDLHDSLRCNTADYWSFCREELELFGKCLRDKLTTIETSPSYAVIRGEGREILDKLKNDYPELEIANADIYCKSVKMASGLYHEVLQLLEKAPLSVNKRLVLIKVLLDVKTFFERAAAISAWCVEVVIPTCERQEREHSVSLIRLRMQERQFEKFLSNAKPRLDEGERLLFEHANLWQSESSDNVSTDALLLEEQRGEVENAGNELMEKLEQARERLYRTRDLLADRLICHNMLERVYDWALYNAKWSSQLGLLVSSAVSSNLATETADRMQLLNLHAAVQKQLDSYPTESLRQLPAYADRLKSERIATQAKSLAERCSNAEQMLHSHSRSLSDLLTLLRRRDEERREEQQERQQQRQQRLNKRNSLFLEMPTTPAAGCSRDHSPASTDYEQPISVVARQIAAEQQRRRQNGSSPPPLPPLPPQVEHEEAEVVINWRRRSYAEEAERSRKAFSSVPAFTLGPTAAGVETNSELIVADMMLGAPSTSSSVEDLSTGVITKDMTEKVVSSMSASTLRKRLAERRSTSAGSGQGPSPLPNPLALQKGLRLGSERCHSKQRAPFCKLSEARRPQTTVDGFVTPLPPPPPLCRKRLTRGNTIEEEEDGEGEEEGDDTTSLRSLASSSSTRTNNNNEEEWRPASRTTTESATSSSNSPPRLALSAKRAIETAQAWRPRTPPPHASPDQRMQCMIVNELIETEISYVRSLQFVIENYVPEMQRDNLPQELRGKRHVIFGNIEKIYEFHVKEFFPELLCRLQNSVESVCLEVAKCFIDFRSRFHLYALYNKNKPKSDVLLTHHSGTAFFRSRQNQLGDKLDLSSYLLKPVQRVGKYALLLQQLSKACPQQEQESVDALRKAEDMVSFQLRHGNDLLAMDLISGCDVNLKEQGSLLRQDEFTVTESNRRGLHHSRKCVRRVFLFEHMVLFAKPKRRRGSSPPTSYAARLLADTYQYKFSIKMSDCGLTERVGDSELKLELWFRRHTSNASYVVQATSPGVRHSWVTDITRILWRQAVYNRELRIAEMQHMGIGERSSCVDLASDDRIEDRAVASSLLTKIDGSVAKFRNSFAAFSSSTSHESYLSSALQAVGRLPILQATAGVGRPRRGSASAAVQFSYCSGARPHSFVSSASGSSSCTNSSGSNSGRQNRPGSIESGICADLAPLCESPELVKQQEQQQQSSARHEQQQQQTCFESAPANLFADNASVLV